MNIDPRCEICCQHAKTTGHLLWECPLASNVWALSKGCIQKCQNHAQDFFLLFKMLVGKLEKKDVFETWAMISWAFGMLETSFLLSELKLIKKKSMIVLWTFSKSTRGIWLLSVLKRVVWPSCSISGPLFYYFFSYCNVLPVLALCKLLKPVLKASHIFSFFFFWIFLSIIFLSFL